MLKPSHFGYNYQTAASNRFQQKKIYTDIHKKTQQEFDTMLAQMESQHIHLHCFEDVDVVLPDAVFPNNWISHFPDNTLVIYPMMAANRQAEIRPDIIQELSDKLSINRLIDLSEKHQEKRYLEGTGSIVFDHDSKTAYSCLSPRTDLTLLSELCNEIGYSTVSFESVDLQGKQIYHTNVMMSIGSQLFFVCLESITNPIERKMLEESLSSGGKRIIDLSYQQMNAFAANTIELLNKNGDRIQLMSKTAVNKLSEEQKRCIEKELLLLPVEIPTIENIGGGSVRCMIAGFYNHPK